MKGAGAASKANGVFALFLQGQQQLLFAVQMQNMPATPKGTKYALWLAGPGNRAKWIGDTPDVGKDGVLQVQGPRQQDTTLHQGHRQLPPGPAHAARAAPAASSPGPRWPAARCSAASVLMR